MIHSSGNDDCAFDGIQAKRNEDFLRLHIDKQIKAFCLRADTSKSHIDDIRSTFILKLDELVNKAKMVIDYLVRTEQEKVQTNVAGILQDIDKRLDEINSGLRKSEHVMKHVTKLFTDLLDIGDSLAASQIDFKVNNKMKEVIDSSVCIGKVQFVIQKKILPKADDRLLLLSNHDFCSSLNPEEALISNNVSIKSICIQAEEKELNGADTSYNSEASSSFCVINTYGGNVSPKNIIKCTNGTRSDEENSFDFNSNDSLIHRIENTISYNKKPNPIIYKDIGYEQHNLQSDTDFKECNSSITKQERKIDEYSWSSFYIMSLVKRQQFKMETDESNTDNYIKLQKVTESGDITVVKNVYRRRGITLKYHTQFLSNKHNSLCVISDITMLPDKRVIFTDHYHNNIQLFNSSFKSIAEVKCPYPMSICTINDKTVAVTLRRSSQVALFRVDSDGIKCLSEIAVPCSVYIWNVVFKAGRLHVVCDNNDVHVLTLGGKQVDIIMSGVSVKGGYIRYFDVSDDGQYLYLCEGLGLRLRCLDRFGRHIWSFDSSDVPMALRGSNNHVIEDVCYTNGRLLATNWMQNKIFEISLEGIFVKEHDICNLDSPRALSVSGDSLVVTQFSPNIDNIKKRTIKVFKVLSS